MFQNLRRTMRQSHTSNGGGALTLLLSHSASLTVPFSCCSLALWGVALMCLADTLSNEQMARRATWVREDQGSVLMPAAFDVVASRREVHRLGNEATAARDGRRPQTFCSIDFYPN